MSWNLNTALRHHAGKKGSYIGFRLKCDEAGWVRIDALLRYDYAWNHITTAFENRKIKLGGEEEKANHAKLLKYVILHKVVERPGCAVCPACLRETPVKYSRCKGMMMSHGRKHVEITSAEEEEESDEDELEVDDGVEIKQEPTAEEENDYKDAVDQGEQEADAAGRWSFDESEVDYGDEEEKSRT